MTKWRGAITSLSAATKFGGSHYPALFSVQTLGAAILLSNGVPLYREVLANPDIFEARGDHLSWGLLSIVMMQFGYWVSDRIRPAPPRLTSRLLGHIVLFIGRMSFVIATSIFGFLFIVQKPGFHIPASSYIVVLWGLFALYCYTRELEKLGRALLPDKS